MNPPPGEHPLPDLHQAILEAAQVEAYFADLAEHAALQEITAKSGPRTHAAEAPLTLDQAHRALLQGDVRGVQIRYDFQGDTWWDTLMAGPQGIRLVRLRLADALPKSG